MREQDREEAEALVRRMIQLIGDDPYRAGLMETPARVVRSWEELFSGYSEDCADYHKVFSTTFDQIVAFRDIRFFSTCEHHLLPFHGKAHVAYLPGDRGVIGASKVPRIVNAKARRLQLQEQLTAEIADELERATAPRGVAVVLEASHLCVACRGVSQDGARMITSKLTGVFLDDQRARAEVLSLLNGESR